VPVELHCGTVAASVPIADFSSLHSLYLFFFGPLGRLGQSGAGAGAVEVREHHRSVSTPIASISGSPPVME
jgi:hypothetical protein